MDENNDSILSLVDSGTWRSAIFTSYTLSLTYVESHVLPRLRRQNCQRLTILVDQAGYRDTLVERMARGIGREYSVVPVHVASGIFHPKLVHLQAADCDGDLLLVGSGNLTYSGHGGNVEVLEALRPATHATAFMQVADFFEQMATLPRITVADPAELMSTATRLRDVAGRGSDTEGLRFIHSLTRTGLEQFVEAGRDGGAPWQELLVLSPYHHPHAEPVRQAMTSLGISKLIVGVSTKVNESCAFPFESAKAFTSEISTVAPITNKASHRSLHAKWLEARRPGSALVLTGSFNATNKSLVSTDNVECGVLRFLSTASEELWEPVAQPPFRRNEFPERTGNQSYCIFASLNAASEISGRVLGRAQEEIWDGRLETAERIYAEGPVQLAVEGTFTWTPSCSISEMTTESLQLTLTREGLQARGWVNVSRVLEMSPVKRNLLQAMARLNTGAHADEDMQCVLDIISEEAGNLWAAVDRTPSPSASGRFDAKETYAKENETPTYSAAQFAGLQAPALIVSTYDDKAAARAVELEHHGWDLLRHILAALVALPKQSTPDNVPGKSPEPWSRSPVEPIAPDEIGGDKAQKEVRAQLARATKNFETTLELSKAAFSKATSETARRGILLGRARLLLVWSVVELRLRLLRLNEVETTQTFLWDWYRQVCGLNLAEEQRDFLVEQVCGVAAASALWLMEHPQRKGEFAHSPRQVHRLLDRFFAAKLEPAIAIVHARGWLTTEAGQRLVVGRADQALNALEMVLGEPTERQVLVRIFKDGLAVHEALAEKVLGVPGLAELRRLFVGKSSDYRLYSLVNVHTLSCCPRCNYSYMKQKSASRASRELDSEISWRLRQHGFHKCPNCREILVALDT